MKKERAFSATTAPGEVPSQLLYNNKVRERKVIDNQQRAVLDLLNVHIFYNLGMIKLLLFFSDGILCFSVKSS